MDPNESSHSGLRAIRSRFGTDRNALYRPSIELKKCWSRSTNWCSLMKMKTSSALVMSEGIPVLGIANPNFSAETASGQS